MTDELVWAVAVVVGLLSAARLTRLLTQDSFPPAAWLRRKWDEVTDDGDWSILAHCHWCMGPWMTLPVGAWALLSELHISWWLFNGWLAAAYVVSMIVERDEKD